MVKCIAIDMDGTLLNNNHVVSEENADAIKLAQKNGVEVVIATGRAYSEAKDVLAEAGIVTPIICVNGAEARKPDGTIVSTNPIPLNEIKKLAAILDKHDIYFEIYTQEGTYSKDYDKAIATIMDVFMSASEENDYDKVLKAAKERMEEGNVKLVDSFEPILEEESHVIYKLLAFSLNKGNLEAARYELLELGIVAVSSSGKDNLEITSADAQKGIALTTFTAERGISMEETMALGDNYNDVSMFERVGRAVAMGNAPDGVKAKAHIVTDTNVNSGVAKAIIESMAKTEVG
ncbi:Cof-type HAD-IIB family hydrolase [Sutcliffiella horikoshii]|uniref:Cof-type HAD-IIB family hydrolase n=1 Tax=Sutcliffiella horikoshii TaxID=79883 RepID=UPI00203E504B|nr:Cof-type HAD-IIB family hydrolase [Sutcliffiella horikoshii]MCM3618069.1 Cof-type HAD-IIB family hydrolase [Sutcliffiella horikoshii]